MLKKFKCSFGDCFVICEKSGYSLLKTENKMTPYVVGFRATPNEKNFIEWAYGRYCKNLDEGLKVLNQKAGMFNNDIEKKIPPVEMLRERIRVYRAGINQINSELLTEQTVIRLIKYECTLKELIMIYNEIPGVKKLC